MLKIFEININMSEKVSVLKILFLAGICLDLPIIIGLKCYECGELRSILPTNDTDSKCRSLQAPSPDIPDFPDRLISNIDTCSYDITYGEFKGSLLMSSNVFQIGAKQNPLPVEVCYTLRGKFRGESLVMRGCDALPMDNVTNCPKDDLQVWFETEAGREDIEVQSLCICNKDFCNVDPPPHIGGSINIHTKGITKFLVTIIFLVIVNFTIY